MRCMKAGTMAKSRQVGGSLGLCSILAEKADKSKEKITFSTIGRQCLMTRERKELSSYGAKPDVIIIN